MKYMGKQTVLVRGLLVALLVGVGLVVGWLWRGSTSNSAQTAREKDYPLLARRILAEGHNDILINFVPLRKQIETKFQSVAAKKSFYFEYLPDGTSIRQGADQELIAASLIKVPLVMNLYKAAELGRLNLDQKVTITQAELDDAYGDLYKQGAGVQLTLREAAAYTLKDSDNTATHVVFDHVKGLLKYDEESLARLDVDQNLQDGQAVINARSYSSVLKSLYYSSYLQKEHSQEILQRLSESSATSRLTRGVPSGVPVAHKNGVFNTSWSESDCGIVYVPKRPYVICVMVGLPEPEADQFIASVSKDVYDFVVSQQ
jgi:beta-lactamase class A